MVRTHRRRWTFVIAVTLLVSCSADDPPDGQGRSPIDASATGTDSPSLGDDQDGDFTISSAPLAERAAVSGRTATFPLAPSEDGHLLIDQDGEPFQIAGDAAWSMLVQLDLEQTDAYLTARKRQGFNTLLVNLIEHHFSDDPPRNAFGDEPLLGDSDFSRPNPAYFDAAHAALERAASMGFLVLLVPAYLGYEGGDEGWYESMVSTGPEALGEYGRFVGERFGDLDNIIWVHGGDFMPPDDDLDLVEAVRDGIIEGGARQLHTAHWSPETSATDVGVDWLDLNTTYTYGPVYVKSSADAEIPDLPHLVIESQYEDDIWDNTDQRLRSQAYEAMLTGAVGSVFGNGPIWQFESGWEDALRSEGARQFSTAAAFFKTLPWHLYTPKRGGVVINPGEFGDSSYVVASATPGLDDIVAYVPEDRAVGVDLVRSSGTITIEWFDPTIGVYSRGRGSIVDGNTLVVEHPGENSSSDNDWILTVHVDG